MSWNTSDTILGSTKSTAEQDADVIFTAVLVELVRDKKKFRVTTT